MLRKRTRSYPKNPEMKNFVPNATSESDVFTQNHKNTSFLKAPGLFVGFNPRYSDSDSARSPTSPLDFRIFSGLGNPFWCPKVLQNEGHKNRWDSTKVGLSIIDSLDDETKQSDNVSRSSDNKNILFGRKMSVRSPNRRLNVDSVEAPVVIDIAKGSVGPESPNAGVYDGSRNLGNLSSSSSTGTRFIGSVPASEIQLSEDYTCVRTHGPNPKVTHIFGDCILECCNGEVLYKSADDNTTPRAGGPAVDVDVLPPNDFLKFCFSCRKKLDGEDIFMYRGEKAFCSYACRSEEIEMDEEMEMDRTKGGSCEVLDEPSSGFFITT